MKAAETVEEELSPVALLSLSDGQLVIFWGRGVQKKVFEGTINA